MVSTRDYLGIPVPGTRLKDQRREEPRGLGTKVRGESTKLATLLLRALARVGRYGTKALIYWLSVYGHRTELWKYPTESATGFRSNLCPGTMAALDLLPLSSLATASLGSGISPLYIY